MIKNRNISGNTSYFSRHDDSKHSSIQRQQGQFFCRRCCRRNGSGGNDGIAQCVKSRILRVPFLLSLFLSFVAAVLWMLSPPSSSSSFSSLLYFTEAKQALRVAEVNDADGDDSSSNNSEGNADSSHYNRILAAKLADLSGIPRQHYGHVAADEADAVDDNNGNAPLPPSTTSNAAYIATMYDHHHNHHNQQHQHEQAKANSNMNGSEPRTIVSAPSAPSSLSGGSSAVPPPPRIITDLGELDSIHTIQKSPHVIALEKEVFNDDAFKLAYLREINGALKQAARIERMVRRRNVGGGGEEGAEEETTALAAGGEGEIRSVRGFSESSFATSSSSSSSSSFITSTTPYHQSLMSAYGRILAGVKASSSSSPSSQSSDAGDKEGDESLQRFKSLRNRVGNRQYNDSSEEMLMREMLMRDEVRKVLSSDARGESVDRHKSSADDTAKNNAALPAYECAKQRFLKYVYGDDGVSFNGNREGEDTNHRDSSSSTPFRGMAAVASSASSFASASAAPQTAASAAFASIDAIDTVESFWLGLESAAACVAEHPFVLPASSSSSSWDNNDNSHLANMKQKNTNGNADGGRLKVVRRNNYHSRKFKDWIRQFTVLRDELEVLISLEETLLTTPPSYIDLTDEALISSVDFIRTYSSQTLFSHLWHVSYHTMTIDTIALRVADSINALRRERYQQVLSRVAALIAESNAAIRSLLASIVTTVEGSYWDDAVRFLSSHGEATLEKRLRDEAMVRRRKEFGGGGGMGIKTFLNEKDESSLLASSSSTTTTTIQTALPFLQNSPLLCELMGKEKEDNDNNENDRSSHHDFEEDFTVVDLIDRYAHEEGITALLSVLASVADATETTASVTTASSVADVKNPLTPPPVSSSSFTARLSTPVEEFIENLLSAAAAVAHDVHSSNTNRETPRTEEGEGGGGDGIFLLLPQRTAGHEILRRTMTTMAVDCSIPGVCNKGRCERGTCVCLNDPAFGHWSGTFCNECDSGWAGPDCNLECNGGYCNPCSGHGTCSYGTSGDGSCVCNSDSFFGYWTGNVCDECIPGFFGEFCKGTCAGITAQDGLPCYGRGTCSADPNLPAGTCICDYGWGSASDCLDCDTAFYGSMCTLLCKGAINVTNPITGEVTGVAPCSGHGVCNSGANGTGTCTCDPYYAGPDCAIECPNRCSGRGYCNDGADGNGKCSCDLNFAPPSCATCYPNVTGPACNVKCPEGGNGKPCSGNGWCVLSQATASSAATTSTAAAPSRTTTPPPTTAPPTMSPMNSNETTNENSTTSSPMPTTTLTPATTTATTAAPAPTTTAAPNPSGLTAVCECADGFVNRPTDVALGMAVCQWSCPSADPDGPPCSGHGTCRSIRDLYTNTYEEKCVCYADDERGYWTGPLCDECDPWYNQSVGCKRRCPGTVTRCSGHGQCAEGRCFCDRGLFHYCGTACEAAADFGSTCIDACEIEYVFGPNCNQQCPSVVNGKACSGHGYCSNGKNGAFLCQCQHGYAGIGCEYTCPSHPTEGICGGPSRGVCVVKNNAGVCECNPYYSGSAVCDVACPTGEGLACSGRGTCQPDGSCLCHSRDWTGAACDVRCMCDTAHGVCDVDMCRLNLPRVFCTRCKCDTNFTADCSVCAAGHQGENCEGECGGPARTGTTYRRECRCKPYYATASCTVACSRDANGTICGGNGICNEGNEGDGACRCFPLDDPVYFGPVCTTYCTPEYCEAQGFLNAACNPLTGSCECQDNDEGHWVDDPLRTDLRCTTCKIGFWGPSCTEPCGCNDNGVCDPTSGDCTCFNSAAEGYFIGASCDKCAVGYIGEKCDRANVQITRINNERSVRNEDLFEPSNMGVDRQNTAFAIDSAESLLYVGSPNVIVDISDVDWYNAQYSTNKTEKFRDNFLGGPPLNSSLPATANVSAQIFQVYVDDTHVYYLIQPTKRSVAKILRGVKGEYTTPLFPLISNNIMPLDNSMEIIASAFLEKNIAFIAAELGPVVDSQSSSSGTSSTATTGGGMTANGRKILRSVLIWKSANEDSEAVHKEFPTNFIPMDLAFASYTSSSGSVVTAFIGGHMIPDGVGSALVWELLAFRITASITSAFALNQPPTMEGSIRELIPCWPSEISSPTSSSGTGGGSSSADGRSESCHSSFCACPGCTAINKIRVISGSKMLLSVSKHSSALKDNYLVYIELTERAPVIGELGPKGEQNTLWFLTTLDSGICSPHRHVDFNSYQEYHSGSIINYKCAEISCFDNKARFYVKVAQINQPDMLVTALETDSYSSTGYATLYESTSSSSGGSGGSSGDSSGSGSSGSSSSTSTSSIIKLSISPFDFGIYGTRSLNRVQLDAVDVTGTKYTVGQGISERPSTLLLDHASRLLFCVFAGISRFRIGVFLAYEVTSLSPNIAGLGNSTTIDVWGNGFAELPTPTRNSKFSPPPGSPAILDPRRPRCLFATDYIPAVFVNRSLLRCTVIEVNESSVSDQCIGGTAEVTLFAERKMLTNNQLTLRRAPVVVLDYCEPRQGYFMNATNVRIHGSGFVDEPTCMFYSSDKSNPEVAFNTGTIDQTDPNFIWCTQPAMQNASRGNGLLAVSLDKQQYSEPLLYEIVADARELRISTAKSGDGISGDSSAAGGSGSSAGGSSGSGSSGDASSSSSGSSSTGTSSSSTTTSSAAGVATTSSIIKVRSDVKAYFKISGYVVDIEGHELNELDSPRVYWLFTNITREVECDPNDPDYTWRTPSDGFPYPRCADFLLNNLTASNIHNSTLGPYENHSATVDNVLVLTNTSHNGVITFEKLFLFRPVITKLLVRIMGAYPFESLVASARIEIIEGEPVALAIANRQTFIDNPLLIPQNQPIKPDIVVIIVDVNGNIIKDETTIKQYRVSAVALTVDDSTRVEAIDRLANIPPPISALTYSKVQFSYIHGMDHFLEFTTEPYLKPARTPAIRTARCALTTYKQARTGNCLPCPSAGAICSGTELVYVKPGYWRAPNSTDAIYDCESGTEICLGNAVSGNGSFCGVGYVVDSPRCSVCIPGYAKSGADTCLECMETQYAMAIVVVAFVLLLIGVVIWILMTLRRADTTDLSVVSRTLMNHFQATGELGEFSSRFDPFLRNVFAIQGSGSSFSLNGLQIAGCLLQSFNADYSSVFWGYMASPILFVFLAGIIFIVVRIAGLVPVITDKLRDEIMEDLKSIGEQATTAILLRKYPLYMVVVTTLCVTLFTMYQTLISQATKVLQCERFVVGRDATGVPIYQQYLKEDMSIYCDGQGQHSFYTAALIFAIGYGIGIPASFIFGYQYVNGRVGKPELTKLIFLFLTGGYKEAFYFWQALIMVRKLVIVLVVVLVPDGKLQTYIGMLIMAAALGLQLLLNPAEKNEHNVVEAISLSIITATLSLSLVYFWPDVDGRLGDAVTIILLIITFGALLVFVVFCIEPVKDLIIDTLKTAQEIVQEIKADFIDDAKPKDGEDDGDDEDITSAAYQNDADRIFLSGEGYDELDTAQTNVSRANRILQNGGITDRNGKPVQGSGNKTGNNNTGGLFDSFANKNSRSAGAGVGGKASLALRQVQKRGIFSGKSAALDRHQYTIDEDIVRSVRAGDASQDGGWGGLGGGASGGGGTSAFVPDARFELLDDEYSSPIELPEWGDDDDFLNNAEMIDLTNPSAAASGGIGGVYMGHADDSMPPPPRQRGRKGTHPPQDTMTTTTTTAAVVVGDSPQGGAKGNRKSNSRRGEAFSTDGNGSGGGEGGGSRHEHRRRHTTAIDIADSPLPSSHNSNNKASGGRSSSRQRGESRQDAGDRQQRRGGDNSWRDDARAARQQQQQQRSNSNSNHRHHQRGDRNHNTAGDEEMQTRAKHSHTGTGPAAQQRDEIDDTMMMAMPAGHQHSKRRGGGGGKGGISFNI